MRMIGAVSPASGGTLRVLGRDPERDGPAIRAAPRRRPAGGQPRPRARRRREPPRLRPLLRPPARRDPPAHRRAARVRPARRPARGPRRLALGRDEAPADDRARARQRARADAPRRADHRPRPAGAPCALGPALPPQAARRDARPDDALHGRGGAALRPARDHGPREDRGRGVAARADRALRRARGRRAPLRRAQNGAPVARRPRRPRRGAAGPRRDRHRRRRRGRRRRCTRAGSHPRPSSCAARRSRTSSSGSPAGA